MHVLADPAKMREDRSSWTAQTGAEKVHVQPHGSLKRFNVMVESAFLSKGHQATFAIWPLPPPLLTDKIYTERKGPQQKKRG